MINTVGTLRPFVKIMMIAVTVVVVVLSMNTCYFDKKEQSYLVRMREFKEQSELATQYSDSLKTEITIQQNNARIAESRAEVAQRNALLSRAKVASLREGLDSLKETITDSVEMARVIIPKQDSVINEQSVTISTQIVAIEHLNSAIVHKDSTITLLTVSRDSLQQVVSNIPKPPPPSALPKLTRKRVFTGGVVIGVLLKAFIF
jgi:paraquat-inducible protein B